MTKARTRSGQIVLVLLFMLLGLVFLLLMETDIYSAIRGKSRLQNAGDAAALAGAHWQGTTLNLIGELNLVHLALSCESNETAVAGVVALQERLAVAGPIVGLLAANAAAKENRVAIRDDFTRIVETRIHEAQSGGYASATWESKGEDYAAMLRSAIADGLATGNDNASLIPICAEYHPLYDLVFYEAVAASDWRRICLRVFSGEHSKACSALFTWGGWPTPPPVYDGANFANSEFLGVAVSPAAVALQDASRPNAENVMLAAAEAAGLGDLVTSQRLRDLHVLDLPRTWYFYNPTTWREWRELDPGGSTQFPLEGSVRPEYDVMGATASFRVCNELIPLTQISQTNDFEWTAAAKPFGAVDYGGGRRRVIDLFGSANGGDFNAALVLPSFTHVRLIPTGGVGTPDPEPGHSGWSSSRGASDLDWVTHVRSHVPQGFRDDGCRYCQILRQYGENADHLHAGGRYLMDHSHDTYCDPPSSGGTHRGGGTSSAH